jgi:four helix bundle protein
VWQHALEYDDLACAFAAALPPVERFGLSDQLRRASGSIGLNIAEGTTSQTDPEKHRFLGYAIRSFLETVAAQRLAVRRGYTVDAELIARTDAHGEELYRELQSFRAAVRRRIRKERGPKRRR